MTKIFLSYVQEDLITVSSIKEYLEGKGKYVWIDNKDLLPGQNWKIEIQKAITQCNYFITCLSNNSVNKKGFFQTELKTALDIYQQVPEGGIYIIPIRLNCCLIPESLTNTQYLDWFSKNAKEKLIDAISTDLHHKKYRNIKGSNSNYQFDSKVLIQSLESIVNEFLFCIKKYKTIDNSLIEQFSSYINNYKKNNSSSFKMHSNLTSILKLLKKYNKIPRKPGESEILLKFLKDTSLVEKIFSLM